MIVTPDHDHHVPATITASATMITAWRTATVGWPTRHRALLPKRPRPA